MSPEWIAGAPESVDPAYVVIPAFNEAPVIRSVIDAVCARFPHVVVVNDGSTDDTARELDGARAVLLNHAVNVGQGAALQTGITYALARGAGAIVTLDADGQHDAED